MLDRAAGESVIDSGYAWFRLAVSVLLSTVGGVGMWSVVVVLPAVQAEFGVARATASFPYTLTMMGFATGGLLMGRLIDRYGIVRPVLGAICALSAGYVASGLVASLWQFALVQGLLIGVGSSATFGPLIADVSLYFKRRRGTAVAICASGNYLAGAVWPPIIQHFTAEAGWRHTQVGVGVACFAIMVPILLLLRGRAPRQQAPAQTALQQGKIAMLRLSPGQLQALLAIAAVGCCVAMAMPQVQMVAYCGDLGYGVARGAQLLSMMLALGIVSRIASGIVADRLGGVATLLIGSTMQAAALVLYATSNALTSLYVITALFGLFQGGIVPSYAIIVREYFPAQEAGARVGAVLMASLFGMALGGWMSGAIYDATGSYTAAFINGVAWNLMNIVMIGWLWGRSRQRQVVAA